MILYIYIYKYIYIYNTWAQATEITGRARELVAKFDDARIWKHYTEVNSQFWVFSERPNLETV